MIYSLFNPLYKHLGVKFHFILDSNLGPLINVCCYFKFFSGSMLEIFGKERIDHLLKSKAQFINMHL